MDLNATLHVNGPSATAFGEGLNLDLDIAADENGDVSIVVYGRPADSSRVKVLLKFDPYEWERFKAAIVTVDDIAAELKRRGVVFRAGE